MKKVSIIITTWLESTKPYLDNCIASIKNLNTDGLEVETILVGRESYHPEYPGVKTVYPLSDTFGNSEGMNFGVRFTGDYDYLLFINDDTILTKNSLRNMVTSSLRGDDMAILGPISNCDQGDKYCLMFPLGLSSMRYRQMRLNDPHDDVSEFMDADSYYPAGVLPQSHHYFYCVLIPKKIWTAVGTYEEKFKTGPDDIDYSRRVLEKGYSIALCLDALVWHFSGVTADISITKEMREANARVWSEKWEKTH